MRKVLLALGAASFVVLALPGGLAFGQAQPARFHPPVTPAERALDATLRAAEADDGVLDNLLEGRGERGYRPTVNYGSRLTGSLLAAIRRAERDMVRRECGGRYKSGEICGLDYNPITCAQDRVGRRLVATLSDSAGRTRIALASAPGGPVHATYTAVEEGGAWKVDGVSCAAGVKFNME
jgi:hypothetical protein